MRYVLAVLAISTMALLARSQELGSPPMPHVIDGLCPFECCRYRDWIVETDTELLVSPEHSAAKADTLHAGTSVKAITGHLQVSVPGQIRVLRTFHAEHSKVAYQAGDIVWVYSYLGEGYFWVWYKGNFYAEEAYFYGAHAWDRCEEAGTCWGETLELPQNTWWVNIESPTTVRGWTSQPENFGNKDACG